MNEQRNDWIDISKGIGIILVLIGHSSIPQPVSNFIFAFHMPLFFMASGWVTNWSKYNVHDYCLHKCRTLLVPFFIYSAIVLILEQITGLGDINEWLRKGWQGYALWFVPVLFLSTCISRCIYQIKSHPLLIGACISLVIGVLLKFFDISLPWTLASVPYATFLILIGSLLNKYHEYIDKPRWYLGVMGFVLVVGISHFWRLDMAWNKILPVIPLTIAALAGCTMTATISSYTSSFKLSSKFFQAIGRETYLIIAFSQIISMIIINCTSFGKIERYVIWIAILVALKYLKDLVNHMIGEKIL